MGRLTRDGTAEPISRDQILRHIRGQGNINFPCSADHEQDWQPYPVDPYSAILPLSHKSGALCLYEPLPVSDALGDDFFEIFDVFLVETFFFFF